MPTLLGLPGMAIRNGRRSMIMIIIQTDHAECIKTLSGLLSQLPHMDVAHRFGAVVHVRSLLAVHTIIIIIGNYYDNQSY